MPVEAQARLKAAESVRKEGKLGEAAAQYRLSYVLAAAHRAMFRRQEGPAADMALQGLMEVLIERREAWTKATPALAKKLDFLVENQDLARALAKVASSAGIEVAVDQASLEDSMELQGRTGCRVVWLDLRGAEVAEALSWLCDPFGLEWIVEEGGRVKVAAARRLPGLSAWTYGVDAAYKTVPEEKWKGATAVAEAAGLHRGIEEKARAAMKGAAGASGETTCRMLMPGTLLVFATAAEHAKAVEALGAIPGRAEAIKASASAAERALALSDLGRWSWTLLSGACRGALERESAARLREAWKVLAGSATESESLAASVSLFALTETALALGGDAKEDARRALEAAGDGAFKPSPNEAATLYRLLALLDARALGLAAGEAFDAREKALREAAAAFKGRTAAGARVLLGAPGAAEEGVKPLLPEGAFASEDDAVLCALAARKLGDKAWEEFREKTREALRMAPPRGSVAVLLDRLEQASLPLFGK